MAPHPPHPDPPADRLVARLRAAGCVYAEDEAALLLEAATDADDLERRVAARVAGDPLEQVLGWAAFDGLRISVEPGAFVPRLRTSLLVTTALDLLPASGVVLDLCCGTGAIAAALRARRPTLETYAADLDPAAVRAARRNLPPETVFEGDLLAALPERLRGRLDVIVANAPYVPTAAIATMPPEARDHEHRVALDGGADGLDVQRRVAADVGDWLAPGGSLVLETSPAQLDTTLAILAACGLTARGEHDEHVEGTVAVGRLERR